MFKRGFNFLALILLVLIITGCAFPFRGGPNKVELNQADYGVPPADYQEKIEIYKSIKKMEEENEKDRYGK